MNHLVRFLILTVVLLCQSMLATQAQTCPPPFDLYTAPQTTTRHAVIWNSPTAPAHQSYTVQYRATGGTSWTQVSGLTTRFHSITGLSPNTTYEWQVQGQCSFGPSSFTAGPNFQTVCQRPGLVEYNRGATFLNFQLSSEETSAVTYELGWARQTSPTSYSTITGITASTYSLTGLLPGTGYFVRLRATCPVGGQSVYTENGWTTNACQRPITPLAGSATANSVQLQWFTSGSNPSSPVEVRYRPVGTTSWNVTSPTTSPYTLTGLTPTTTYQWEVRSVCATGYESVWNADGSNFTTTAVTLPCAVPTSLTTTDITRNRARFSWDDMVEGNTETYNVRWQLVGALNWTTVTGWTVNTYPWAPLFENTAYEWQVQTVCAGNNPSAWSASVPFTTPLCESVIQPESILYTGGTVLLTWSLPGGSTGGFSYTVRYRLAGTNDPWIMLEWISGPSYQLTGLPENQQYEWQLRLNCSGVTFSDYTASQTFTTIGCQTPPYPHLFGGGFSNGAAFAQIRYNHNFSFLSNTTFNIRWRAVGVPNWQIVNIFSSPFRTHEIGNLTINTAYEWQIQTVCGTTGVSAFSPLLVFSTSTAPGCFPYVGTQYTLKNGDWTDHTVWSCGTVPGLSASINPGGNPVELRHAVTLPANTTGWAKPLRYTSGGQLILGNGARIRTTID